MPGFLRIIAGAECQIDRVVQNGFPQSGHVVLFHFNLYIGIAAVKLGEDPRNGDGTTQRSNTDGDGLLVATGKLGDHLVSLFLYRNDAFGSIQIDLTRRRSGKDVSYGAETAQCQAPPPVQRDIC